MNPEEQATQDQKVPPVADKPPEQTLQSQSWLDKSAGPWVAAASAWLLGIGASVFQFAQSVASGSEIYSWFFAVFAFVVGLVLVAYAIRVTKEDRIRKYFVVLLAILPLLLGSASMGFLFRDTTENSTPSKPMSITITTPVRNQLVGHNVLVKGVVVNKPPEKQIWIAVTGQMNAVEIPYQFYVKGNIDGGPCTFANNNFECDGIFVGLPQDANKYALMPVIADQSQAFGFQQCMKDDAQVKCANIRPDGIQLGEKVFIKRE